MKIFGFSVDGWPENKSRIATDYINYDEQTTLLEPDRTFRSPERSIFHNCYLCLSAVIFFSVNEIF